jgi:hypothetical protein
MKNFSGHRIRNGRLEFGGLCAAAGVNYHWACPNFHSVTSGITVTNFYKQTVYDPSDNKIGDIDDYSRDFLRDPIGNPVSPIGRVSPSGPSPVSLASVWELGLVPSLNP